MLQYSKISMVTKTNCAAYHATGSLSGEVESSISDLIARLGIPPSKFLVSILNFLRCKLVHLNPNAIAALSYFTMLCERWIGLSLHCHRRKEYLDATFKDYWKGTSQRSFLVDMHTDPQWMNKHLLLSQMDDKRREPKMTPLLQVLVKRVTELHQTCLRACHYAKGFTLPWFHPLVC
jgi:hypothetical protein